MNPLFDSLFGQKQGQIPLPQQQAVNPQPQDMNAFMSQYNANPAETMRGKGFNVPDEIAGNPQATVMHLIRTGQVGGPVMQRIQPMLQRMGIRL